ncbi:MAG: Crp/Fnr family transcriptional regulator [Saprospiraceae bacterium]|nr:Crp/Fnr family transcriptional regulator [Saprospiraceae bacterium]
MERFIQIDAPLIELLQEVMEERFISKKDFLLQEGQRCLHQYFVVQGCFRMFYINPKGMEQIITFGIEDWWITDYDSLLNQQASEHNIQALEDAVVLSITREKLEYLFKTHRALETYFRIVNERVRIADQRRLQFMFDLSGEELYDTFYQANPGFVQRIPQYMLASYLGFTPEFLSKIRSKKRK